MPKRYSINVSAFIILKLRCYRIVRYRRSIIEERGRQHNHIQKVLEGVNIKLGSLVSTLDRKDKKCAGVTVAHAILKISYYLLTSKEMYVDLE